MTRTSPVDEFRRRRLDPMDWAEGFARLAQAIDATPDEVAPQFREPDLSFLRPAPTDAMWNVRVRMYNGVRLGLQFVFNPDHLRALFFTPPPALALRSGTSLSPQPQLLLSDIVTIEDQSFAVVVTATPTEVSDEVSIHATINSGDHLPNELWCNLTWGNRTWRAPVTPAGEAQFEPIPLHVLQAALDKSSGHFAVFFSTP